MNPLKWSAWVRIAVVVTILWMVGGSAVWYGKSERLGTNDIIGFLFPVILFWSIVWIVLGISNRKIRVRVIKILIGIVIGIAAVLALAGILIIQDSLSTPPTSLAPQSSVVPQEIPPTTLPRLKSMGELEKKLKNKGEERHKPKPGGDSVR